MRRFVVLLVFETLTTQLSLSVLLPVPRLSNKYIRRDSSFDLVQESNYYCRVGTQGPCGSGQKFGPLRQSLEYSPLNCEDVGCTSILLPDESADCVDENQLQSAAATNEVLADQKGICVWAEHQHPCQGRPASFRYFNDTKQCHSTGDYSTADPVITPNPCKASMQFIALDDVYGDCDCNEDFHIYWPPSDQCFHTETQGPCSEGQWLTLNARGDPRCVKAVCLPDGQHVVYPDPQSGLPSCFQLGTQGPCSRATEILSRNPETLEIYCRISSTRSIGAHAPDRTSPAEGSSQKHCRKGSKTAQGKRRCKAVFTED